MSLGSLMSVGSLRINVGSASLTSLNSLISLNSLFIAPLLPLMSYKKISFDATCQKVVVTLHRETKSKPFKTLNTMGVNYTIECRNCGAHSEHYAYTNLRTMRYDNIQEAMHIDTEYAIRCPVCRSRLNTSEDEFKSQVKMVCVA